jgi:hypothetical protein
MGSRRPDSEMLGDGTLLMPFREEDGRWEMLRVQPGDERYARFLSMHQARRRWIQPTVGGWITAIVLFLVVVLVVLSLLSR